MYRLKGYPRWFHAALLAVLGALLATGMVLVPSMLEMRTDWPSPVHVDGNARQTSAILHSVAGFFAVAALGSLVTLHVRIGWRAARGRVSGVLMLSCFTVLLGTAVVIYYAGDPDWSRYSSLVHTSTGLALAAAFVWHLVSGRRHRLIDGKTPSLPSGLQERAPALRHHPGAGVRASARKRDTPRPRRLPDAPPQEQAHSLH